MNGTWSVIPGLGTQGDLEKSELGGKSLCRKGVWGKGRGPKKGRVSW